MLSNLRIIHRPKPHVFALQNAEPLWATCLRSLAFVSPDFSERHIADQTFEGDLAYQFLLEIVCGLHSPVVGETEVFGQFKVFAQDWLRRDPSRVTLVQTLLSDAKFIRRQYLSGLGTQSYGSWIRKNLVADRVHVLGGGILAGEIIPYLAKNQRELRVHVRNLRKVNFAQASVCELSPSQFDGGAVIVAAPMSADEIRLWIGKHSPKQVFDLREIASDDVIYDLGSRDGIFVLQDIFAQIEVTKKNLLPVLNQVRAEILARVERVSGRSLLRPLGWDDICA